MSYLMKEKLKYPLFYVHTEKSRLFCAEAPSWGNSKILPLTKLQEDGVLENNKLIIEVNIKVTKVADEGKSTENEIVVVHGFHVLNSQVSQ